MTKICPNCKTETDASKKFCKNCGSPLDEKKVATAQAVRINSQINRSVPSANNRQAKPAVTAVYTQQQPNVHVDNKKKSKKIKTKNQKKTTVKNKKNKNFKKTLKKLIPVVCTAAAIAIIWLVVGNQITLTIHTNKDLEVFNSGSLDVPGAYYNRYAELPDYVVEMLGEDPEATDYGPLMSEIIPHIKVERNKVNGWFCQKSVEYTISAPDMETWLLNVDEDKEYTEETLLEDMLEYIPSAPMRSQIVTIDYAHDGFFGWQGNYMSLDFANAVSGGINTAYNKLYEEISDELEAALK